MTECVVVNDLNGFFPAKPSRLSLYLYARQMIAAPIHNKHFTGSILKKIIFIDDMTSFGRLKKQIKQTKQI